MKGIGTQFFFNYFYYSLKALKHYSHYIYHFFIIIMTNCVKINIKLNTLMKKIKTNYYHKLQRTLLIKFEKLELGSPKSNQALLIIL